MSLETNIPLALARLDTPNIFLYTLSATLPPEQFSTHFGVGCVVTRSILKPTDANKPERRYKSYEMPFYSSFFFFEKITYCCRARHLSVRPSVKIISFRGISISNRPIDFKMSMNVRKGVVHVRKA